MSDHFTINKRLISGILAKYRSTFDAFCELITNSIHAKAKNIFITIETSELFSNTADVSFHQIQIKDDGVGVSKREFKTKILDIATESRKAQGGKGVGRFAAIQLGSKMEIETVAQDPFEKQSYKTCLTVNTKDWQKAQPLDRIPLDVKYELLSTAMESFYSVTISNFYSAEEIKKEKHLRMAKCFAGPDFAQAIFERYTDVIIKDQTRFTINGKPISSKDFVIGEIEYDESTFLATDGTEHELKFQFMQVKSSEIKHRVLLRVENGDISTVAHSYDYTGDIPADHQWIAFIDSPYFGNDTDMCRGLFMSDLNPDTAIITDAIKAGVDGFFAEKYAAYYDFSAKLQGDTAYPYRERNASSTTRASVFNQLAYYIEERHHLLKRKSDIRKLIYSLVDRSLNLGGFDELISKVIQVNEEVVTRFSGLLKQVDLEDVVTFCDEVKAKEQFLDFLHKLNYAPLAKDVGERAQLHKIVQRHLWIFGEQYADCPILFSDKNLKNNLEAVRNEFFNYAPTAEDENDNEDAEEEMRDITDLFFFNEKLIQGDQREIMIVELKAPRVKLGAKELQQAKKYALKIQTAGVFPDGLKYKIILIGRDISAYVKADYGQIDAKRPTLVHKSESPKEVQIWVAKWSDLIAENRQKLTYLGNQLATKDREVQEYWHEQFGEVPTKEIFSKMQDTDEPRKTKKRKRSRAINEV